MLIEIPDYAALHPGYRRPPPNTAKNTNNANNIPQTKKKIFHPDFGDSPTTSPDCPFTKNRYVFPLNKYADTHIGSRICLNVR